jgi:hypothetical protein
MRNAHNRKMQEGFFAYNIGGDMTIERSLSFPDLLDRTILTVNTCYADTKGERLLQDYVELTASDTFGGHYRRISDDNGAIWSLPQTLFTPVQTPQGTWRRGESTVLADYEEGAVLHFFNMPLYPEGIFSGAVGQYTRIFLQVSFDKGATLSAPFPLIETGKDPVHWCEGVTYGKNSAAISFCNPVKHRGTILLPVQKVPEGADFTRPFDIRWESGCFIGRWNNRMIEWELGETVTVDETLSSRGLCEPAIAELSDGRLLMVVRTSNSRMPQMKNYRRAFISSDHGKSWQGPRLFSFDDGSPFFSPATGSWLLRHRMTGKLFWIANILDSNPDGNRPRYPLQIAEIDEEKIAVKKKTLVTIDTKRPEDSPLVQFSNFRVYEERGSGDIILFMARLQEKGELHSSSFPLYSYRIRM